MNFLGVAFIASVCTVASAGEKAVHLRGTQPLVPMAQYMAETYMRDHPNATIVVSGGGTYRGYKSLLDGTADIAMASSSVQEDVTNLLSKTSPTLVRALVGYTALVPVVHPDNPLQDISMDQLRGVFSGRIKNWKELGGKDAAISILIGPPTDGLTTTWKEAVLGEFHSFTPKSFVTGADDRIKKVARDLHAITFVGFGNLNSPVKPLAVQSRKPSVDNVRDGTYPLSAALFLVTTSAIAPETQRFLHYFSTPNKRLRLPGIVTAETID